MNVAINLFDEDGPNLIPGIEKFGKFVLVEQVWNYIDESAYFDQGAYGGPRPEGQTSEIEFSFHRCSLADDYPKFYAPDAEFEGSILAIFESLLCLDNPEDIKFFGNFNTDLGVQY